MQLATADDLFLTFVSQLDAGAVEMAYNVETGRE